MQLTPVCSRNPRAADLLSICTTLAIIWLAFGCASNKTGPAAESTPIENEMSHNGVRSVLTLDTAELTSGPNQFLQATFTVVNAGEEPLSFTFRSSQQTDFAIEDENGRELWRWSEGKFFAMMMMEKTLSDQPWVYELDIPTVDRHGQPLPEGTYRLHAWLLGERKIENTVSFQITGSESSNQAGSPK